MDRRASAKPRARRRAGHRRAADHAQPRPRRTRHAVGALSHGVRQWVEIGMVIAQKPKLILLDEPTAGMAADEVERTVALLRAINRETTLVVVERDMQFVGQVARLVTVFHQGRILIEGSTAEVLAAPAVREVYLGSARA
ncbi:MAG: ATP-binding cassette domain-containing protein [Acetobacteraceae bacterium]